MRLSSEKKEKIEEQILLFLFEKNPQPLFTSHIAKEIARDEEFVKKLLEDLLNKKLIVKIKKNKEGIDYSRRSRWKLSPQAYKFYKENQL